MPSPLLQNVIFCSLLARGWLASEAFTWHFLLWEKLLFSPRSPCMGYFNSYGHANYTFRDKEWPLSVWTQQTHWTSYSDHNSIYYLDPSGSHSKSWRGFDFGLLASRYLYQLGPCFQVKFNDWKLLINSPVSVFGEEPGIYLMWYHRYLTTSLVNRLQV